MKALQYIGIALCVLIAICITVNLEAWRRAAQDRQLAASVQTQASVLDLYVAVLETESGQRGYIITGNVLDAEDYYSGADRVHEARQRLTLYLRASGASADQRQQLKEFDDVLKLKLTEMASTIQAVHDSGPAAAVAIVKNQSGLRMMKHLRSLKDTLIASTREGSDGR